MGKIQRLDVQTANRIAAGEVVERPASVVKELCDNALDAKASIITIEIENGGVSLLRVTDNGSGMDEEDAQMAFVAHATSKLVQIQDLDTLLTMGFRGEALASIASVAKVELITRQAVADHGFQVQLDGGQLVHTGVVGAPVGTRITVRDLFYNTPARFKFLKKDATEAAKIVEIVERLALSRPDVSFKLVQNGKTTLHTPGNNNLNSAVFAVFGGKIAQDLIPLPAIGEATIRVEGLIGQPGAARNSRAWQLVFVNQRPIKSPIITHALDEAYRGRLMKGKYPFALLKLQLPQNLVDINVHPQKLEVRFWDQNEVYRTIYHAVKLALEEHILPPGDWQSLQENVQNVAPIHEVNPVSNSSQFAEQKSLSGAEKVNFVSDVFSGTGKHNRISDSESIYTQNAYVQDVHAQVAQTQVAHAHDVLRRDDYHTALAKEFPAVLPRKIDFALPEAQDLRSTSSSPAPEQIALPLNSAKAGFGFPEEEKAILRLSKLPIIGQAFNTYIILQDKDKIWLVDQHAAHEKILFEKLYANFKKGEQQVQPLLLPLEVQVKQSDKQLLFEHQEIFAKLGYQFEDFGDQTILLRAVPASQKQMDPSLSLLAVLDYLQNEDGIEREDWLNHQAYDILAEVACKAAIKGNDALGVIEQKTLLEELERLDQPYNCPHGRPVVIMMSKYELEKKFKRIL